MKLLPPSTWTLASLLVILAIDAIGFGLVLPLLPYLVGTQHATILTRDPALAMGLVLAVFPICSMVGTPLLGYCSDKLGRRPILLGSLLGTALGLGITSLAIITKSLIGLIVGRGLTGLLGASQPLAQATVTDIAAPARKAYWLGWVAVAMTVGMLAGPMLGGALAKPSARLGLALPFVVATLLALLNAGFLAYVFKETHQLQTKIARLPWRDFGMALLKPSLLPKLIAFTGLELSWSWCFQGLGVVVSPYAHWSALHTATVMSSLGICMSLGLSFIFPFWLKRASVKRISGISLIIMILAWLMGLISNLGLVWVFAAAGLTIAVGIGYTAILTELSDATTRYQQGWLMGVAASLLALAWAVSGLGLGWVNHTTLIPWLTVGFVMSIFTLACWLARFGFHAKVLSADLCAKDPH